MNNLDEKWDFVKEALHSLDVVSQAQVVACDTINHEGAFMQSAYKVEGFLVEALAKLVDDKGDWLYWFVYENHFGEKALEVGSGNDMKQIKTLDDLRALIETEA